MKSKRITYHLILAFFLLAICTGNSGISCVYKDPMEEGTYGWGCTDLSQEDQLRKIELQKSLEERTGQSFRGWLYPDMKAFEWELNRLESERSKKDAAKNDEESSLQTSDAGEVAHYVDEPDQTDAGAANNIIKIFEIGNPELVFNGGTPPTFTLNKPHHVTELWTYHWNDGKGAPAGTLALKTNDGQNFGPWQARLHNNVYWIADINQVIPAGQYTVIDSDPSTLAQNDSTGGQGMAWMYGYPAD